MSCADAPTAANINSAIAASSANARPARSVFRSISPPYFQTSLESAKWRVGTVDEEPRLPYKTHAAAGSFIWQLASDRERQYTPRFLSLFLFGGFPVLARKFA